MAESLKPQLGNLGEEKMDSATDDSGARLSGIIAQATLKYSVKDYDNAAELYSQATELQAKLNGEMSSRNADLLYAYGRCLYHVAVRNSDVLGSKVAGGKHEERTVKSVSKKPKTQEVDGAIDLRRRVDEEAITEVGEKETATDGAEEMKKGQESKPYFQFTGDENFDLSDEEDNDVEGDEEDGPVDEEDDFVNAYEVLDLARVLLLKKLGEVSVEKGTCKGTGEAQPTKQLKERLADTYDLQAEISLEGEGFPNAVVDLKAALTLKQELFPQESSLIAEAHYKLSLALEFSSVTQQKDENSRTGADGEALVDEAMREEAAKEMEAAIASCKLRIQLEEARLGTDDFQSGDMEKQKVAKENIREVKDMVKDMEQRLIELRQPPVSINDPTGTGGVDIANPLSGILGPILGESPAAQKARIEEASKDANDLTSLVKRKKPTNDAFGEATESSLMTSNGKRKVGFSDEVVNAGMGKKVKLTEKDEE